MSAENVKKEPLVRIAKRPELTKKKAAIVKFSSIIMALFIGGLLILVLGHNPFAVYADMVKGSLVGEISLTATAKIAEEARK